uniref:Sec-independent protein translocase component TatC n=1 Tax=Cryptomonas gyropyrenoidosa TaxID=233257 RepID=UPI00279CAE0D|nr:Sec-independent protein translocase component TatC [Cryptomonas gyropyrenoidosa]WFQ82692.1 Sec-independent protein translocase component TatC [Cryptomonas gyropyrenoidosa]
MLNIINHLNELKLRTLYTFFGYSATFFTSYLYSPQLFDLMFNQISRLVSNKNEFVFLNVFEIFNSYIKLSYYISFFCYLPIIWYFFFSFIKPGLFEYEVDTLIYLSKFILKCLILSLIFGYFFILPQMLTFFLNSSLISGSGFIPLKMQLRLQDFVTFICEVLTLYSIGLSEILIFFLIILSFKQFRFSYIYKKRKLWILICLILGSFFPSPDLINLFLVTMPLLLAFEILVFFSILKSIYSKLS